MRPAQDFDAFDIDEVKIGEVEPALRRRRIIDDDPVDQNERLPARRAAQPRAGESARRAIARDGDARRIAERVGDECVLALLQDFGVDDGDA